MDTAPKQLYVFLSACAGNWRNSVFIAGVEKDSFGYLLSADQDGQPIVMAAAQFQQLSGESIDPAECCGQLSREAFKNLFAQYLLWHLPSAENDPLRYLSQIAPSSD